VELLVGGRTKKEGGLGLRIELGVASGLGVLGSISEVTEPTLLEKPI